MLPEEKKMRKGSGSSLNLLKFLHNRKKKKRRHQKQKSRERDHLTGGELKQGKPPYSRII